MRTPLSNRARAPWFALVVFMCAAIAPRVVAIENEAAPANARNAAEANDRQSRRAAIERFEAFLAKYPESATRADVLLTLADLHAEEEIEAALAGSADDGAGPDAIPHAASIRCLTEIAERFPSFARREEALYRLGYLCADARDDGAASAAFDAVVRESPSGAFAGSARVRLAEIALRRGDFAAAAAAFRDALAHGADARVEEVHYRLAWALYRMRDFDAARETLVDGILAESGAGADPEIGLVREMIHLLAVIAAATPGTAHVDVLAQSLDGAPRRVFFTELGEILLEEDRAAESLRYLDDARAGASQHDRAPSLAQAAIEASLAAESREHAATRMIEFANAFGTAGEWRRDRTLSPDERERIDALCEENLYRGGALLYEAARDSAAVAELAPRAEAALNAAVAAYPEAAGVDDARFMLGELARSAERWNEAAEFYAAARVDRVGAARREALLYGRVLALEGMRQGARAENGGNPAGALPGTYTREIVTRQIAAIDVYLDAHPNASDAQRLVEKRADLLVTTGAHAAAAEAYARIAVNEAKGSPRARELAAKRGAALVNADRPAEAAAAFEEAAAPEEAAAALYEAAQQLTRAGHAEAAGLGLFSLCARYPGSSVAFAAVLDGVELLANAQRYDTLAVCVSELAPLAYSGAGQVDSLRHAVVAAAARAESENALGAAPLFIAAARFGDGPEVAATLVRAADLETARADGAHAAAALLLLERARPAAARGAVFDSAAVCALRVGIARRLGDTFARLGRERDCLAAYDDAIALGEQNPLASPALDRELALAALQKADILRAAFEKRASSAPASLKETQRQRKEAGAICDVYARAAARAFRDLTPRACVGAADFMIAVSRTLFSRGLAKEDASLLEEARLAAAAASSYRATAASLDLEHGSEWAARVDATRFWRDALITEAIARADSIADAVGVDAAGATSADAKRRARAIVRLGDLAHVLETVSLFADAPDAGDGASAALALRRGALHEEMIALLLGAPLPADLGDDARAAYTDAVEERTAAWRGDALAIYRAEIARANARHSAPAVNAAASESTSPWMTELNGRAARLADAAEINSSLTQRPSRRVTEEMQQ
ncbi:MAG: tetratricopeptide repeat protein [bacterium]